MHQVIRERSTTTKSATRRTELNHGLPKSKANLSRSGLSASPCMSFYLYVGTSTNMSLSHHSILCQNCCTYTDVQATTTWTEQVIDEASHKQYQDLRPCPVST